ncbi:MAG: hypothetical protein DRJ62_03305 [Thermoprotei archaeon]|nr:MAG: hypothetical protein DRJ62_03305 [Thermoprotei archaeon]
MASRAAALASGFAVMFIAYAIRYDYGALLPSMVVDLSLTELKLGGAIFTSYFIAYMVFSPIMGGLTDRFTAKPIVVMGCALMGLGSLMLSFSKSLLEACMWYGLAGVGAAGTWTPVSAATQRWFSRERRGLALGFMIVGICTGFGLTSLVTPYILDAYSWRTCWLILGVISLLVALIVLLAFQENPNIYLSGKGHVKKLYLDVDAWLVGVSYMLVGFAILVPFTYLPMYSIKEVGAGSWISIWLISLIAVGGVAGALTLPALSDRVSDRRRVIVLSNSLVVVSSLIALLKTVEAVMASAVIFGLAYGAIWPLYGSCASEYFGEENAGKVVGFWTLFLGIGSIASPIASGALADATGTIASPLALASMVAALSLLPLTAIKRVKALKST